MARLLTVAFPLSALITTPKNRTLSRLIKCFLARIQQVVSREIVLAVRQWGREARSPKPNIFSGSSTAVPVARSVGPQVGQDLTFADKLGTLAGCRGNASNRLGDHAMDCRGSLA
jgi:hypothetical protein